MARSISQLLVDLLVNPPQKMKESEQFWRTVIYSLNVSYVRRRISILKM